MKIEILAPDGKVIRTLETDADKGNEGGGANAGYALPAEVGLNRAVWDLRTAATTPLDYGIVFGAAGEDKAVQGYRVAPGTYGLRVSLGATVMESAVEVRWDPAIDVSTARVEDQQQFLRDAVRHD